MTVIQCQDISVIQGDILEVYFAIDIDNSYIKRTYFTCRDQSIEVECPYSTIQNGYCLRLSGAVTKDLPMRISSYDFTVEFMDGEKYTVLHNKSFMVLKKRNKLCEDIDEQQID